MNNINECLAGVINMHAKLVKGTPMTNYNLFCRRVHKRPDLSVSEKMDMLLSWDVNPRDYTNPTLFGADWQLKKFLAKLSIGGSPSQEDKDFAYTKFLRAEARCSEANKMMQTSIRSTGFLRIREDIQRIVSSVLGDVKDFFNFVENDSEARQLVSVDMFTSSYGRPTEEYTSFDPEFGPGISVGPDGDKLSSVAMKLIYGTVTAQCAYIANWITSIWKIPTPSIVKGSVLTFVPKRVGEARTICYEPSMNMLIQKLLGRYIKIRLKAVLGIDLADQTKNREMARLGSLCDSYSTIDLSSASDLLSNWFVTEVTPYPWLRLLDDCRSKQFFDPIKKSWSTFEKFSTMGNGFTFELETLLFAAITLSAVRIFEGKTLQRSEFSIYGDDIIVPKDVSLTVMQCLTLCGHIPNLDKTYLEGPFRESCGGDFFNGWEVTPLKIKDYNHYEAISLVTIHNLGMQIHSNVNHVGHLSGWFDRHNLSLRIRAFSLEARLSEGPIEYVKDHNCGSLLPVSSNRYLWSEAKPCEWRNVRYSRKLHALVPARLLIAKKKVREYDMHPDVVPYAISLRSKNPCLVVIEEKYKCVRNSKAFS